MTAIPGARWAEWARRLRTGRTGLEMAPKQVAALLGVAPVTVRRWAVDPAIGRRWGELDGRILIKVDGLRALFEHRATASAFIAFGHAHTTRGARARQRAERTMSQNT